MFRATARGERILFGAALLLIGVTNGRGQSQNPGTVEPAFEVASVKLTPPGSIGLTSIGPYGTGRFTATNVTLEVLVELAFGVNEQQIQSAPAWLGSERYDITAIARGGEKLTYEQLKRPLQGLLAERFKLATHRETKETQAYALVAAKDGAKLKASTVAKSKSMILPNGLRASAVPVATLAGMLALVTRRPVVDETGIAGTYDIKLDYVPADGGDSSLPSMFTALQEQAGLKLEPRKVPAEILIIDHVERVPVEN